MKFHPDVLAAHAEFGGDLQAMQALYDRPDHIARIAALEAQLAELAAENERMKHCSFLARVAAYFDASDLASSFMSEDGDGGFLAAIHRMTQEIASLRAEALSRTGAVKVKVKGLEWEDISEHEPGWWAAQNDALCLGYEVRVNSRDIVRVRFPQKTWETFDGTTQEAKAAAQADYERRILSALEPAAPEGQQEPAAWQHIPNCGVDRESKMVHVTGKVFCDPCIEPLVAALNAAGIETVASCCGHGHRPGVIALRDGRELVIAKDFEEARKVDAAFPTDINGDARPSEQAVTEALSRIRDYADKPHADRYVIRNMAEDALKAAMEAGRHE